MTCQGRLGNILVSGNFIVDLKVKFSSNCHFDLRYGSFLRKNDPYYESNL
jgi:hypothetical protein